MDEERVELEEDKANLAEEKALYMKIAEKLETMHFARICDNVSCLGAIWELSGASPCRKIPRRLAWPPQKDAAKISTALAEDRED